MTKLYIFECESIVFVFITMKITFVISPIAHCKYLLIFHYIQLSTSIHGLIPQHAITTFMINCIAAEKREEDVRGDEEIVK